MASAACFKYSCTCSSVHCCCPHSSMSVSLFTHNRNKTTMVPACITLSDASMTGTQYLNCSCVSASTHTKRQIQGSSSTIDMLCTIAESRLTE